jgi:hypothetical protein
MYTTKLKKIIPRSEMKKVKQLLFVILLSFPGFILAQVTYQGPATGWVPTGVMITTDNFTNEPLQGDEGERVIRHLNIQDEGPMIIDLPYQPEEPVYVEDPNVSSTESGGSAQTILLQEFAGLPMTNSIPPDPHIAVGPNHVLACVNSRFAIWDKQGNLLKNISADAWYASVLGAPGPFDPQIVYDHYANRWFMLWDSQNDNPQRAHFLISVSDDDNPLGVWYNYALPANQNGMTVVSNWGDFPQVGFDEQAIYINARQFTFTGFKQYDKIRILNKAELYSANGDSVYWKDIWDITYPHNASRPDVIRPVVPYSSSSNFYFIHTVRGGGNIISLYWITNPLTTPVLQGVNIPVTFYGTAPNADQLGGSSTLISSNGSGQKTASIYRDGFIWVINAIQNPTSPFNAALAYYKINTSTNSLAENFVFGAADYWYIFPALTVDKDQNVAVTYSRSSTTEYIGGYYSTRLANDPPGFNGSVALREGQGNYVVTFGGDRNRWGDYLGIYLDPVTEYNVWIFPEFASATNQWGTWVGEIRMVPFPGTYGFVNKSEIDFGSIEINFTSSPQSIILANYGLNDLIINSIPAVSGPFNLVTNLNFPITLSSYDSLTVEFEFAPTVPAVYEENITISTNQPGFTSVTLKGRGFEINAADVNVMYASTGASNNGDMLTIDIATGSGTLLGPSLFNEIKSIAIHPQTRIMYGLVTSSQQAQIIRINALNGDAYNYFTLPIGLVQGIAFDTLSNFYAMTRTGEIYTIDLSNQNATLVANSVPVTNIAINPLTNELWASSFVLTPLNRDRIFKVNKATGDTMVVGNTGFEIATNGIAFDGMGNLYGVTGTGTQTNNLIQIDTSNAEGTIIGEVGFLNVTGLTYLSGEPLSVDENNEISVPKEYTLRQNYPNPFKPFNHN